jgi:hypothetical protein
MNLHRFKLQVGEATDELGIVIPVDDSLTLTYLR